MDEHDSDSIVIGMALVDAHRRLAERDPAHEVHAERYEHCFESFVAETYAPLVPIERPEASHWECKRRDCLPCFERNAEENYEETIDHLTWLTSRPGQWTLYPFKATSPAMPLRDCELCLNMSLAAWETLIKNSRGDFRRAGYVRGVRFHIDVERDTVCSVVSAAFVVRKTDQIEVGAWNTRWRETVGKPDWHLEDFKTPFEPMDEPDPQRGKFLTALVRTGVNPADLCDRSQKQIICDEQRLLLIGEALSERRLFGRSHRQQIS